MRIQTNIQGDGFFTRDVGRLPPQVRKLLEEIKDEKITSIQAWRYPLMKPLQNIIKKIVKLPYDSIFHLGVNLNGKYNLEKDVLLKFTKGRDRGDVPENKSKVVQVTKDITFGELFDGLRKKMGDAGLTQYNARTNNCQDFSLAILSVLGIDDPELKTFIKQDAEAIYKSFGIWEKLVEAGASLSTLKDQVVDRLTQGEGNWTRRPRVEPEIDIDTLTQDQLRDLERLLRRRLIEIAEEIDTHRPEIMMNPEFTPHVRALIAESRSIQRRLIEIENRLIERPQSSVSHIDTSTLQELSENIISGSGDCYGEGYIKGGCSSCPIEVAKNGGYRIVKIQGLGNKNRVAPSPSNYEIALEEINSLSDEDISNRGIIYLEYIQAAYTENLINDRERRLLEARFYERLREAEIRRLEAEAVERERERRDREDRERERKDREDYRRALAGDFKGTSMA